MRAFSSSPSGHALQSQFDGSRTKSHHSRKSHQQIDLSNPRPAA
jgi:hypothetical protein